MGYPSLKPRRPSATFLPGHSQIESTLLKNEDKNVGGDDIRVEYDFASMAGGVQGKYAKRYMAGTNLVHLEPDVAAVFRDESSVNKALRTLIDIAKSQVPDTK